MVSIGIIILYLGMIKMVHSGNRYRGRRGRCIRTVPEPEAERITGIYDGANRGLARQDFEPTGARWHQSGTICNRLRRLLRGFNQAKYMYVSEPQNDMIFHSLRELGLWLNNPSFAVCSSRIAWRCNRSKKSRFGALLNGIVFQVGLQTVLTSPSQPTVSNTASACFSYGGSSLLILLAEMGMILSVSRYSAVNKNRISFMRKE